MSGVTMNSWEEIRTELLRRINARFWKPGDVLPTEIQLAAEFGCSRATVNRAMRELADTGIIERRRKAGTRVAVNPVRKATLDIPVTRLEIEGRGLTYRFTLLERAQKPAPALVASRLGLAAGSTLLHLRTLHFANGQPLLYEDRWLNPEAIPEAENVDFSTISINEWLVRNIPYTYGDIAFSAANATKDEAEHLGTAPGIALFIVERTTWKGSVAVTSVRLAYAPGYRLHTVL